jgi:REP element-mobilizing transposase RayT
MILGLNPAGDNISQLVASIKRDSSFFINRQDWFMSKFSWQEGYGAFAMSKSHLDRAYKYVINQEEHHRKKTFREEYIEALEKSGIEYDERYLFKFFDLNI